MGCVSQKGKQQKCSKVKTAELIIFKEENEDSFIIGKHNYIQETYQIQTPQISISRKMLDCKELKQKRDEDSQTTLKNIILSIQMPQKSIQISKIKGQGQIKKRLKKRISMNDLENIF